MFDSKKLRAEIRAIQREYADAFHQAADNSRADAMRTLKPGQPAPATGRVHGEDNRTRFEDTAAALRGKCYNLIESARKDLSDAMSEAPTTEAVNAIGILKLREKLTESEVQAAIDRYGNNYLCYQALRDIAGASGVSVDPHPLENAAQDLAGLSGTVGNMTLYGAEKLGTADTAMLSFVEALEDARF